MEDGAQSNVLIINRPFGAATVGTELAVQLNFSRDSVLKWAEEWQKAHLKLLRGAIGEQDKVKVKA